MATIRIEQLNRGLADDIHALVTRYYDTTPAHEGLPPYDFDWEMYFLLRDINKLLVITAREGTELVGVGIYVLTTHPHHKTMKVAECDTLAVDVAHRGNRLGEQLYTFAEDELRKRGVQVVTQRYRTCYDTKPLFERLGFTVREHMYAKELT